MNKKTMAILIVVLAGLLVWAVGSSGSGSLAQGGGEVGPQAVLTPLLQYQGRLTDPGTGEAVADGVYPISFRLYNVESGGSWLWMETEDVSVQGGLFSTVLGDAIPLDPDLFNGQALWLGVKVGADTEATPRQQVLPVAYALGLVPGAVVEANSSSPVLQVNNTGSGDALSVGGDLNVSGSLTGGSHNHDTQYVNAAGPDTISGNSSSSMLNVTQSGAGNGIYVRATGGGRGAVILSYGTSGTYPTLRVSNVATSGAPVLIDGLQNSQTVFKVEGDGSVRADGGFHTPAADFAEMMAVNGDSADYEPGDVLVISSVKDRAVELSYGPYATNVIGIYSTKPGFVGTGHDPHETQPGEIPVAISGIVPCKVSAENGSIRRGDLLTTSNTPGHAMKADAIRLGEVEFYPPGTIVGKALEELSEGTSVISVLVALQ